MIKAVIFVALVAAASAVPLVEETDVWSSWKAMHNKVYAAEEEAIRKVVFEANIAKARMMNAMKDGAEYGLSKFADLTEDEFKNLLGFKADKEMFETQVAADLPLKDTPTEWDWTTKGAVTPVKNQGMCGSCWAFSTTGDIEGAWFLSKGKLQSLSEQQLVSCDDNGDQGCNGGLPSNAFAWVIKNGGLEAESSYPYEGVTDACKQDKSKDIVTISSWEKVSTNEDQIAAYLAQNGPLSIGINAANLQLYMGGISDPFFCSPKKIDHGVLIVGYGEENGKKFWKIKNSWGEGWGEKGYFRIIRGKGKCGLNTMVTHSKV
jgi:C1A family cysteine protease